MEMGPMEMGPMEMGPMEMGTIAMGPIDKRSSSNRRIMMQHELCHTRYSELGWQE